MIACALTATGLPVRAVPNCPAGTEPDLIVGEVYDVHRFGAFNTITAYGLGATACNVGTCRANWFGTSPAHPVIAQNLFRLKNGRFEQIGQSWVKHGFAADTAHLCSSSCIPPGDSLHLGVNCSDTYDGTQNGTQTLVGPKFEVNAFTGVFPYPPFARAVTGNVIYKRLQVHNADLLPSANAGALYFAEVQYVSQDDAVAGNGVNNVSYRQATVTEQPGVYIITLTGTNVLQKAAIQAWKAADPSVLETPIQVPGEGTMILAASAVGLGGGIYHYEYALQNLNSDRSAAGFQIPLLPGTVVTNVGFHDVDYHSGEPFDGTDWPGAAGSAAVGWSTVTYDINPNANALRWGTLYNFRFDANVPPGRVNATIGLFKPGSPSSVQALTIGPGYCNLDGICFGLETCANCSDCVSQGGGSGCCGNGACEAGEDACHCVADCGNPSASETSCTNAFDDDCDGITDCADVDCCMSPSCACCGNGRCDAGEDSCHCPGDCGAPPSNEISCVNALDDDCDGTTDCADGDCCTSAACDGDGDQYAAVCDCNDANPGIHATPGEVRDVLLAPDASGGVVISWSPPGDTGGLAVRYDALRSSLVNDFFGPAACITAGSPDTSAIDYDIVGPSVRFYLVRAVNDCPAGKGPLGFASSGQPTQGRTCP